MYNVLVHAQYTEREREIERVRDRDIEIEREIARDKEK